MADGDNTTVAKEEFDKLQAKYDRTLGELTDVKKTLEKFKDVDLEALKAAKEELEIAKREEAKRDPDKLDKWKEAELKKLRDEIAKELKDAKEAAERLGKENKELRVTDKVFSSIAGKFHEEAADDLKEIIRKYGDLDESGEIVFKDDNGSPRFKNGNEKFTAEDFGSWLASKKPYLAKATFTGGGKQNGQQIKNGINIDSLKTLADVNRLPNGKEVWKSLPPEKQKEIAQNTKL